MLHEADELLPFQTSIPLDDVLAALLLTFFGVKTLLVGCGTILSILCSRISCYSHTCALQCD